MRPLQNAAILFDLDGTLVDTAPDLAGAMNAVLQAEGRETLETDSVRALVGRGARALLERGFAETGAPAPEEALPGLIAQFLEHYREHISDTSVAYPHARETLDGLLADGARLAVCTNKPEGLARLLLHKLGLLEMFDAVIGGDSVATRKPDAGPLRECVARLGARGGVAMVGDSAADAGGARSFGCAFVWAAFGYPDAAEEALAPDRTARNFHEIGAAVRELLGPAAARE